MNRRILLYLLPVLAAIALQSRAAVTIEQCVEMACANYPLIEKYDIIGRTSEVSLSDIDKSWLPDINIVGQATAQNAVPAFPEALAHMLDQMGADMPGVGKIQYRVGVDVNQTIWDGGATRYQRRQERADHTVRAASIDVQLYAVRERVENLFFGILLIDEQIKQVSLTRELLYSNLQLMKAMLSGGTAMQCDVDMVEAQYLTVGQQIISARAQGQSLRTLLGIYTGTDLTDEQFIKPSAGMPTDMAVARPELTLFDAQTAQSQAQLGSIRTSLMPRVGIFAQAYYGYPGFDYFKSMTSRDLSFNIQAGLKVTWNIGAFYTRRNREQRILLADESTAADREVFLFNIRLTSDSQSSRISELTDIMAEDERIVELRANVRRAAEAQLTNGVIDATALLSKITDENQARLTAGYHEIQLIQSIYQLKYTLNQ